MCLIGLPIESTPNTAAPVRMTTTKNPKPMLICAASVLRAATAAMRCEASVVATDVAFAISASISVPILLTCSSGLVISA